MKKKLLSLLIIGGLFAGMGLSAECFAAPGHHRDVKNNQHKELRYRPATKKPAKSAPKKLSKPASKKQVKKAPPKRHQAVKKHQQTKFKAQKQHQKNVKRYQKNDRKNIRNFKKHQNKTQNRNHRRK